MHIVSVTETCLLVWDCCTSAKQLERRQRGCAAAAASFFAGKHHPCNCVLELLWAYDANDGKQLHSPAIR